MHASSIFDSVWRNMFRMHALTTPTHNGSSSNFTYIKWSRFDISFYNLNVLSESPLTMTSRHECKLFNWYHYTSHRFDEWLVLFKDDTGKQVATWFGKFILRFFSKRKWTTSNGTRSVLRSSFAGAPTPSEWRGQGHMQRGASMKLGLFGTQLRLFCFQLFATYFFGLWKTIVDRGLSFTVSIDCSNSFYMNFRGRYWCGADLLLSLLRQGCQPWVAEGSHLRSSCRQWKVHRETKQS